MCKTLNTLKNDPNIIILKADKGNSIVIPNKSDYTSKMNNILDDSVLKMLKIYMLKICMLKICMLKICMLKICMLKICMLKIFSYVKNMYVKNI